MIHIVTGTINSGKTTKLLEIHETLNEGDGFVSLKHMRGAHPHSYEALRLSTGEKRNLIIRDIYQPDHFESACEIGPYRFNKATIDYMEATFDQLIASGVEPLFLDEVGLLEMEGKCLHDVVTKLVGSGLDIYLSIRVELLDSFLDTFDVRNYEIIRK